MVPNKEVIEYIQELFPADITTLFHHVLIITYFKWDGLFYEQTDRATMGSPLNPAVVNFYMETF